MRTSRQGSVAITEGEIDAITAIECGFPLSVSVPDGAPAENAKDYGSKKGRSV